MFNYTTSETVIPTLAFTKAELVYLLKVILKEIPDTDNYNKIEMVEVRHYMNQIKDRVSLALADGTIGWATAHREEKPEECTPKAEKPPEGPSMADLKRQFPNLSEDEIKEVLQRAKEERRKEEEKKKKDAPPLPPPMFVKKPIEDTEEGVMQPITSIKAQIDKEETKKFFQLLGA